MFKNHRCRIFKVLTPQQDLEGRTTSCSSPALHASCLGSPLLSTLRCDLSGRCAQHQPPAAVPGLQHCSQAPLPTSRTLHCRAPHLQLPLSQGKAKLHQQCFLSPPCFPRAGLHSISPEPMAAWPPKQCNRKQVLVLNLAFWGTEY